MSSSKELRDDVIDCKMCELHKTRTYPVIGIGSHNPKVVFVGEAPGREEDLIATPFVGKSGQILRAQIHRIGLKDVYLCNVLKCRPPENRDPSHEETENCSVYLRRQIEVLKPLFVVTLGRFAMETIKRMYGGSYYSLSECHGSKSTFKLDNGSIVTFIPFFHPAAVLYNPLIPFEEDFNKLKELL